MTDKKLSKLLEELHHELDGTEAVDEKGRELLRALNADIEELLDRSELARSDEDDSLFERWQAAIDHFEVTHPTLTTALSHLMTALNNAGI
jgi:chromosome segregation ATPase